MAVTVKFNFHCACGAHFAGTLPGEVFTGVKAIWDEEHKPGTDANGVYHGPATAARSRAARAKADRRQG